MATPPSIAVTDVSFFERDIHLRMPFRFGIVTLTDAPQLFVKVTIEATGHRKSEGYSAEVLAPKWFDKNPDLSNDENFEQLRTSARRAAGSYLAGPAGTPFSLFASHYSEQMAVAPDQHLVASFGQALLDRAVIDALCRLEAISFYEAVRSNRLGIGPTDILPDLRGTELEDLLPDLTPSTRMQARHTIGLLDPLTHNPDPVHDGLPETLAEVIDFYGHQYFKVKVGGDLDADIARLIEIATILDQKCPRYVISLDGNEQYSGADAFLQFFHAMEAEPGLQTFFGNILYIEQPISRATALMTEISSVSAKCPVIIDESDSTLASFPEAIPLGYKGVSTKSCKGLYKSLANLARCRKAGGDYFLSGEDLTMQPGIGVQQDLALVSLLGLTHVERNGHHYVDGFYGTGQEEQQAFLKNQPGLYHRQDGVVRLKIQGGELDISSLDCLGFASNSLPGIETMRVVA